MRTIVNSTSLATTKSITSTLVHPTVRLSESIGVVQMVQL